MHIENNSPTNPFYIDLSAIIFVVNGRTFRFKDSLGNAGSYEIHIRPNGADTIDGTSHTS